MSYNTFLDVSYIFVMICFGIYNASFNVQCLDLVGQDFILCSPDLSLKGGRVGVLSRLNCISGALVFLMDNQIALAEVPELLWLLQQIGLFVLNFVVLGQTPLTGILGLLSPKTIELQLQQLSHLVHLLRQLIFLLHPLHLRLSPQHLLIQVVFATTLVCSVILAVAGVKKSVIGIVGAVFTRGGGNETSAE